MSFTFKNGQTKNIFIEGKLPQNVILAAKDLIKDIQSVCGNAEMVDAQEKADIIISCRPERFSYEEEFCYEITSDKIYFSGKDDLGVLWAIYTFSERELKIPPFYLFDGITVEKKDTLILQDTVVREHPHTKFRGWFINDEDLLSGFRSKGERCIDYRFYNQIVHPDMMEKIMETALRFRINLIIPATLVDICNPDEENLIKIAAKRGLYVSQHHIEPLGVSHFGLDRFLKENGYREDSTYTTNPEALVACWEHYAQKWAKYPRVIWQLGLRGKGDVPVWASDKNVGNTDQARGELISSAIFKQYEIIKKATGQKDIYSTSTVWMEGAKLLQSGHLTLPKSTIVVFADIGITQLFGDDFFTVPRITGRNYGVYYHSQYWHVGPHLVEGVLPEKMDYCYKLARENQSDYYSVLNVGNIKEFTFSINLNAKIAWYGDKKSNEEIILDYCKLYTQKYAEEMQNAIRIYYASLGDLDERNYWYFCKKHDFNYHKYEGLSFPVMTANDGILGFVNRILLEDKCKFYTPIIRQTVKDGYLLANKAYKAFEDLQNKLGQGYKGALLRGWLYQTYFWINMFGISCENVFAVEKELSNKEEKISQHFKRASEYAKNILEKRVLWHDGEWEGWFNDERKIDIQFIHEFCIKEENRLKELGR